MSSCLSGAGRTYGFELDIVKSPSPSPSSRSSHSSSPSSTLSESSNSALAISTKRPRTPRKRPNQTYNEAAALLSTIYPNIFSTKNLRKLFKHTQPRDTFSESSELLPPFPALGDAGFLIRDPVPENPDFRIDSKPVNSLEKGCRSLPGIDFQEPNSPSLEEDFDAESILDEEIGEGIDSIMGNLSVDTNEDSPNYIAQINPYLGNPMGFGYGGKFELGLGFGFGCNMRRALRRMDEGEWWRSPTVPVLNMVPKPKASSCDKKKKKKKKVENLERKEVKAEKDDSKGDSESSSSLEGNLSSGLSLKLNYEEVLKAWSDGGSPFSDAKDSTESHADTIARLAQIELFPEEMAGSGSGGGVREARVMRYKEKRRTRLFSKKIRYQVRKANADTRPRMQGRFVRRPSLLH